MTVTERKPRVRLTPEQKIAKAEREIEIARSQLAAKTLAATTNGRKLLRALNLLRSLARVKPEDEKATDGILEIAAEVLEVFSKKLGKAYGLRAADIAPAEDSPELPFDGEPTSEAP